MKTRIWKNPYRNIFKYFSIAVIAVFLTTSCEDYLNKAPEVSVSQDDVFTKWINFQGFVEDMYQGMVDPTLGNSAESEWNYANVGINSDGNMMIEYFAKGDYWRWYNGSWSAFRGREALNTNSGAKGKKGYWHNGWYTIRNANIAIANIDKLNGTQEEHDLLLGQAYWFRAYMHFEILRSWGRIPYVDTAFSPSDPLQLPQESYREVAEKINKDFERAAQLLPVNWDQTTVGQATIGQNAGRLTKGAAYGFLGKNLLYEASPLMNQMETGTYTYDQELLKKAATAFNEVIKLTNQGVYGLEDWANYKDNFYTLVRQMPIGKEIVATHPVYMYKRWNYGNHQMTYLGGWGTYLSPGENYVEKFGMANGLPISEGDSGYDPADPWTPDTKERDPRFYYNIVYNGYRQVLSRDNADTWVQFYVGGRHRDSRNSITGYGYTKFRDVTCNNWDRGWGSRFYYEVATMRLPDVYLMYAEAINEVYGPTTVPANIPGGLTAAQAVNFIRARAGVPDVDARFLNKDDFREVIINERDVELAFEGHRWFDLRRWHRSHLLENREVYGLEFDAAHTYFNKVLYRTNVFEDKHWWLPFQVDQVSLYPEFTQNAGW